MDFIKRLIKLAMEYQDAVAEENSGAENPDEQSAATFAAQADGPGEEAAGTQPLAEAEAAEAAEPPGKAEAPVKTAHPEETGQSEDTGQLEATVQNKESENSEGPGQAGEPEPPIEPAMYQNSRQAQLGGEDVTDTFICFRPRRPSFFDKD